MVVGTIVGGLTRTVSSAFRGGKKAEEAEVKYVSLVMS